MKIWKTIKLVLIFGGVFDAAYAAGLSNIQPHRAVYDLNLIEASDRSGIAGMQGRIVYEVKGSACEGFAVRFRFFTTVDTRRKSFTSDHRTTSFESSDGNLFRFVTQSYLNGQLEREVKGTAERLDGQTNVQLSKPKKSEHQFSDGLFMTAHLSKVIDAAVSGETFFTARVYDGSENGDEIVDTTAVIGAKKTANERFEGEAEKVNESFTNLDAWPVTVSYFDVNDQENVGEKLPIYSVSFILHRNGVSRRMKMNYQDYKLKGDLKEIEFLKAEPCQ